MKQHNYLTVLFTKRRSKWAIGSLIIMFFERFPASHCAIMFEDNYILESRFPVSRLVERDEFLKTHKVVKEFKLAFNFPEDFDKVAKISEGLVGINYSIVQLVTIGIGIVFRFLRKFINRLVVNGSKSMVCTELAFRVLYFFFEIKNKKSFDSYSLRDLYRECLIIQKEQSK